MKKIKEFAEKYYKEIWGLIALLGVVVLFYILGRNEIGVLSNTYFIIAFLLDGTATVYSLYRAGMFIHYDGQENDSEVAKSNKSEI